jgi:hypothetical protein
MPGAEPGAEPGNIHHALDLRPHAILPPFLLRDGLPKAGRRTPGGSDSPPGFSRPPPAPDQTVSRPRRHRAPIVRRACDTIPVQSSPRRPAPPDRRGEAPARRIPSPGLLRARPDRQRGG